MVFISSQNVTKPNKKAPQLLCINEYVGPSICAGSSPRAGDKPHPSSKASSALFLSHRSLEGPTKFQFQQEAKPKLFSRRLSTECHAVFRSSIE